MSLIKPRKPKAVAELTPSIIVAPFEERLLRIGDVAHMVGLARSTIYKLIREGKFPLPIKRTARASAWKLSEIQAYIQNGYVTKSRLQLVGSSGVSNG